MMDASDFYSIKPNLYFYDGKWWCEDPREDVVAPYGYGATPLEAYNAWVREACS